MLIKNLVHTQKKKRNEDREKKNRTISFAKTK